MSIIDFAKKHPVGVGIGVIAIIGVVLIVSSAGGGTEYVASDGTSSDGQVQAGLQLQALQIQASGQAAQVAADREVSLASIAAGLAARQLETQSADTQTAIAANVAQQQISAGVQVSSMQLANEAAQIAASKEIQLGQQLTITKQSEYQVQQTQAILNSQTEQAKIAAKPKGLFSWLFG